MSESALRRWRPTVPLACKFCAGLAATIATLAMAGWIVDSAPLRGVLIGQAPMNPITALAVICAAVALWIVNSESASATARRVALGLALLAAALGAAKLACYAAGRSLVVDRLLFPASVEALDNQIAPNTALALCLIGAALAAIDSKLRSERWLAEWLALAGGLISLLALVGYAYGVQRFFGVGQYTPMALNTALAGALLSVGILLARPDRGLMVALTSPNAGGRMIRQILPVAIILPIALGWLLLRGEEAGFYDVLFETALLALATVVVLGILLWHAATWLNRNEELHRRIERTLDEEQHLLSVLMNNVPEHIFFKDEESRFLRVSRAWRNGLA